MSGGDVEAYVASYCWIARRSPATAAEFRDELLGTYVGPEDWNAACDSLADYADRKGEGPGVGKNIEEFLAARVDSAPLATPPAASEAPATPDGRPVVREDASGRTPENAPAVYRLTIPVGGRGKTLRSILDRPERLYVAWHRHAAGVYELLDASGKDRYGHAPQADLWRVVAYRRLAFFSDGAAYAEAISDPIAALEESLAPKEDR